MTYTPGPWHDFEDIDSHDIMTVDGQHIARVEPVHAVHPLEEQRDNGSLLAAAPELIEALKSCLDAIGNWEGDDDPYYVKQGYAAIAKAEGN